MMKNLVAGLCLLTAALASTPADAARKKSSMLRPTDAVEIFRCGFDDTWDINYDRWPDRWTRKEGPDYPHYVEMGIADAPATKSGKKLQVLLDGAQARVSSPPIRVMPKFRYMLEVKLKIESVEHSKVHVRLDYLNSRGEVRQSLRTDPLPPTDGWIEVTLGPERPRHDDIDRAVVRIETERGSKGDLQGEVSVADVWIGRMPNMDVSADSDFHVYTDPRDVVIHCSLSGISERDPEIRFQLLDATSHAIGEAGRERLNGRAIVEQSRKLIREESVRASEIIVDGVGSHATGYEGSTTWRPNIHKHGGYGFYQVRVKMLSSETGEEMYDETITLAVIPPRVTEATANARGEFGWTLPRADNPLDFATLEKLLPLVGVNWVKMPIWFDADDSDRGEAILQFTERLAASDVEMVGLIVHPDNLRDEEEEEAPAEALEVANVFSSDPSHWMPLFDHVTSRLSLRVRWWQLGNDHDTSFVGYADLVSQIRALRNRLYRFGQDVALGLGWRWDTPLMGGPASWEFHQMASDPPLNSDELGSHLAAGGAGGATRWVLIEPRVDDAKVTDSVERHEARVRELIRQIVAAKRHGADGIFMPNPFSGPHGVMTQDGRPGELLLPWRTAATLLGGAKYIGQLHLPAASRNWLFLRPDDQVVMVVWNEEPVIEELYLGDKVRHIDVWGKELSTAKNRHRDVVQVGRMPSFVLGLNESIARWRMAVRFEKDRLPSIFGEEHPNSLQLRNSFGQGVGGKVSIFVPDLLHATAGAPPRKSDQWKVGALTEGFSGAADATIETPLEIRLSDASLGEQPIRIDFTVSGDRAEKDYRFSVWRTLNVGTGEVTIDVATRIDENGRLVVRQEMRNTSGRPMSFKCFLHAPGRRRKRAQVFELGPQTDVKTYTYSSGEELVGKPGQLRELKLEVEEIDGPRVLVKRFLVERDGFEPKP